MGNIDAADRHWVRDSLEAMRYRGPDETRQAGNSGLLLGFNRLSIRDLSTFGSQPMYSASRRSLLVYNGETYNTAELLRLANIESSQLRGNSDSEVFVEVAEKMGIPWLLKHADGMFAFGLYRVNTHELFLGRDHLGIKPLYLGWSDHMCVFSSEYSHVVKHPALVLRQVQGAAILNYLKYGFIQEGEGILENTMFVPQSHYIHFDTRGKLQLIPYDDGINDLAPSFQREGIDYTLARAVREQLVSDVPLGTFMSGGVDSVLVTSYANTNVGELTAYTMSVDDPQLDEAEAASVFALAIGQGLQHNVCTITEDQILKAIDEYDNALAEPLADFSSLLMMEVSREASKNITVALSGDGGDELFWGYPRFAHAMRAKSILAWPQPLRFIAMVFAKLTGRSPSEGRSLLGFPDWSSYYLYKQGLTGHMNYMPRILNKDVSEVYPMQFIKLIEQKGHLNERFPLELEMRIHLQRVLLKVDRASMYHSLEVRVPFLSKRVLGQSRLFSAADSMGKAGLKLPLRSLLLEKLGKKHRNLVYGRKKGFEPPMCKWLRKELQVRVHDRLSNIPYRLHKFFQEEGIHELWQEHQSGNHNHANALWALYSLFTWVDKHMAHED